MDDPEFHFHTIPANHHHHASATHTDKQLFTPPLTDHDDPNLSEFMPTEMYGTNVNYEERYKTNDDPIIDVIVGVPTNNNNDNDDVVVDGNDGQPEVTAKHKNHSNGMYKNASTSYSGKDLLDIDGDKDEVQRIALIRGGDDKLPALTTDHDLLMLAKKNLTDHHHNHHHHHRNHAAGHNADDCLQCTVEDGGDVDADGASDVDVTQSHLRKKFEKLVLGGSTSAMVPVTTKETVMIGMVVTSTPAPPRTTSMAKALAPIAGTAKTTLPHYLIVANPSITNATATTDKSRTSLAKGEITFLLCV